MPHRRSGGAANPSEIKRRAPTPRGVLRGRSRVYAASDFCTKTNRPHAEVPKRTYSLAKASRLIEAAARVRSLQRRQQ